MSLRDSFDKVLETYVSVLNEEICSCLARIAEEADAKARSSHPNDFHDVTGRLRSSIGAAVYNHGKQVFITPFAVVGNGSAGASKGKAVVERLVSQYADAVVMVIAAGEDYAEEVETRRDVVSGALLWAESVVDARLKEAVKVAEERLNKMLR